MFRLSIHETLHFLEINKLCTFAFREGKLHCSCQACTSDCFGKNAVKIIRLNRGYVSLVTRLQTTQCVCCLLVCGSSFLLAAEEGGKLKLWVMNSGWRWFQAFLFLTCSGFLIYSGANMLKLLTVRIMLILGVLLFIYFSISFALGAIIEEFF